MKRFTKLHNSAGDTIVEVMIVLAVLGLAFAISYATANHGLIQARNAEEHSEALGLLDSQVELLRAAFSQNISAVNAPSDIFCMDSSQPLANSFTDFGSAYVLPATALGDSQNDYPHYPNGTTPPGSGSCVVSTEPYHESIVYCTSSNSGTDGCGVTSNPSQSYYDFRIRWDGLGNLGPQQEEINYKISPTSINGSGYTDGTCSNGSPITPAYCWFVYGKSYTSCVDDISEGLINFLTDHENGCQPSAGDDTDPNQNAVYARRGIDIIYDTNHGALSPSINAINAGDAGPGHPADLTIDFNQYPSILHDTPPPNYQFLLDYYFNCTSADFNSDGTINDTNGTCISGGTLALTPDLSGPTTSWNPTVFKTNPNTFYIPANFTSIEFAWTDNEVYPNCGPDPGPYPYPMKENYPYCNYQVSNGYGPPGHINVPNEHGYDPDIQINYVQITPSPAP